MESYDPFASILVICGISSSQENLLSHCRFALQPENVEQEGSDTQPTVGNEIPVASAGIIMISQESSDNKEIRLSSADHRNPSSLARMECDDEEPRLSSTNHQTPPSPPIMESNDPFGSLFDFCLISSSQETLLRHCHYGLRTEGSDPQSTSRIPVTPSGIVMLSLEDPDDEEVDRKSAGQEPRSPSADESKDAKSESEEEREGGEAVDLGRDTDILSESGHPYSQRFETCSGDEQCRKRSKVSDSNGSIMEVRDHDGKRKWAKRVLPISICQTVTTEEKEKVHSILDVLEMLSKKEDGDQSLSILEVAKRCGMTFP